MSLPVVLSHTLQCYRAGMAECGGQHLITWEKLHTLGCKILYLLERYKNPFFLHLLSFLEWGVGENGRETDCEFPSKGQRHWAI